MIRLALLVLLTPLLTGCFIFTNIQGRGTVTSVPAGHFDCTDNTGDCRQEYSAPGSEKLKAQAGPGHTFVKWSNCPYRRIDECETLAWNQSLADGTDTYPVTAIFKPKNPPVQSAQYTYNALGQPRSRSSSTTWTVT